jgi:hypothetical protein
MIYFPIYRKLSNSKNYYKIISFSEMKEIQVVGSKFKHFTVVANKYPEILFIKELIDMNNPNIVEIFEQEWLELI